MDEPRRALATELVLDGVRDKFGGGEEGDDRGSSTNGLDTGSSIVAVLDVELVAVCPRDVQYQAM